LLFPIWRPWGVFDLSPSSSPFFFTFVVRALGFVLGILPQPHVGSIWRSVRVEMAPPMPSEFPLIQKSFVNLKNSLMKGKFLNLTTKEAAANTLVGVEIFFWFIVGEMIGRKSVVGYNV
ncbi:ATP synthase subunit g, partial [Salmonella sp. s51933]|uniref:ATP synthase subunit g n=1 Tax=Salmonella sp. s51933 TaxID=3160127 RepID=UPI00375407F5